MLSDSILKTLKYFDVQDHPLTLLEISKYLLKDQKPYALSEIQSSLNNDLKNKVNTKHGLYFLSGRENIADLRLHNNLYSSPRLKKARKILPLVRHLPFISAIAMAGSEATATSKQGSDIDLLVLCKKNRIWLTRLVMAMFFQALGMRRYGNNIEDRFCLNHYVVEGKQMQHERHLYTAIEYMSLIPFFGAGKIKHFQEINLSWIEQYINQPNIYTYQTKPASVIKKTLDFIFDNFIGDFLEKITGRLQLRKIKSRDNIIIESDELAFHPGNKGRQILSRIPELS